FISLGKGKASFSETDSQIKQGEKALEKLLEKYQSSSFQVKIKQEVFLSVIKTNLISEGFLNIKGQKFRLDLKGKPSSLTVFDGSFLWHQADKKEKAVFKLKDPLQFQILTNFFNRKSFFKNFQIKEFHKKGSFELYHLQPKQEMKGLGEIFMKAGGFILEIRLIWKDLNNWQKYKLSKPSQKDFLPEMFEFPSDGFQVLDQF
ncbi:MAG: outer membrane lipoprotein carrier protein LolA, partial [Oligoflexia bacterium]|nr:outer membrane lipoprotein carrier protein LolA [Oligoflexia bacterium]